MDPPYSRLDLLRANDSQFHDQPEKLSMGQRGYL